MNFKLRHLCAFSNRGYELIRGHAIFIYLPIQWSCEYLKCEHRTVMIEAKKTWHTVNIEQSSHKHRFYSRSFSGFAMLCNHLPLLRLCCICWKFNVEFEWLNFMQKILKTNWQWIECHSLHTISNDTCKQNTEAKNTNLDSVRHKAMFAFKIDSLCFLRYLSFVQIKWLLPFHL